MTTRPGSASTARRRDGALEAFMVGILRRFLGPDDIRRLGGDENVHAAQDRVARLRVFGLLAPAGAGIERPGGGIAGDAQQGLVGADANVGLRGIDAALVEAELLEESILIDRYRPRQGKWRRIASSVLSPARNNSEPRERRH